MSMTNCMLDRRDNSSPAGGQQGSGLWNGRGLLNGALELYAGCHHAYSKNPDRQGVDPGGLP